jgi:hypothetical protein
MKYVCYVALAIFTFAVGVGISPIRFYAESIACGPNSSGASYRSSYFIQTSQGYVTYDTEDKARDAFAERLNQALDVYDRSPKVNSEGVPTDQRAVYQIYHPVNDEYYVEILWREGRTVHCIHSRSYTHVMEFEKRNF